MQSSMFDPKSCCLTHPSIPSLLAHARTSTPAPPSVLMMRPFEEGPRDRRCGISRRGGRALRRRTVVLRRDCSWLTCGAEAEGDRLCTSISLRPGCVEVVSCSISEDVPALVPPSRRLPAHLVHKRSRAVRFPDETFQDARSLNDAPLYPVEDVPVARDQCACRRF